jgi:NADPH:quinone reductase-like Zn-dependent oxidoreductase
MKAVVIREHGGTDKLLIEDLPTPEPAPGEVLIKVEAVALNHLDLWVRRGLPNLKLKYPHILGTDIAGSVVTAGGGWKVGDPVIVQPGTSCGRCRECLSGRDNLCRDYKLLGEHVDGGLREFMAVPAANLVARPTNVSAVHGAALPVTFMTAWQMLAHRARVQPGESVVILAVGSGVGTAGVQIAKLFGARVIATSTSADKLARAKQLGADDLIDTSREDLLEAVRRLTGKRGADVIFEHVGKATWEKSILAAARGGRIVTCGATTGFDPLTDLRHVFFRQLSILGSTMGSRGDLATVVEHVGAGRLKPIIDQILPFAEIRQAHDRLEQSSQFGKIVVQLG